MSVRIGIFVNLDTDSLEEAYERLYLMLEDCPIVGWESSDEWYDAENLPVPMDKTQEARMAVFERLEI